MSGAAALARHIAALKRAFNKNAQQRERHADPTKWAPSELALHDALMALSPTAATPALFHQFVSGGGVEALIFVVGHPNADICALALATLAEFCDSDGEAGVLDEHRKLLDACAAAGVFEAASAAVLEHAEASSIASDEGAMGVLSGALDLFEHACELQPRGAFTSHVARALAKLLTLLLIASKDGDEATKDGVAKKSGEATKRPLVQVGQGVSSAVARIVDTLALLLHDAAPCRSAFVDPRGIHALLCAAALHGREEDSEAVENARNALSVLCELMLGGDAARRYFVDADGMEQMLSLMRERGGLRISALKVFDFACTSCTYAVRRAFECGAVGVLFALLEKLALKGDDGKSYAEHVLGVMFAMFRYADDDERDRLLFKFLQHDGAKVAKLLAVYAHYAKRIGEIDADHAKLLLTGEGSSGLRQLNDPDLADKAYMERLDAGLFVVQLAGVIAMCVIVYAPDPSMKSIRQTMDELKVMSKGLLATVKEYMESIEAADGSDAALKIREQERKRLAELVEGARSRLNLDEANNATNGV